MKSAQVVRNYYVLPCCLLLLNLCIELVSYKAKMIYDVMLRTAAIMGMVLFGGAIVGFLVAPAITSAVVALQRNSRARFGALGEAFFLLVLGLIVFWLYYRVYIVGPESVLPRSWHNPA
ncbi:hypothetical protein [Opitutus sp. ER46]|uniref:hypothetical protein n=1 Tax=Opitutus sp. ER46 TaxID=2161864 RepID=UPI000D30547C|nr:hypothetical protein [Opitutus sp. ER46]PTY01076.1 hypothetical protein DB354_00635 [Opitutus sp. ER46]